MRNFIIIAICVLLVAFSGVAIVLGGSMFGGDREESRSEASERASDDEPADDRAEDDRDDAREADREEPSREAGDTKLATRNGTIAADLAEAARQINAGGPVRIDEITMMTSASSSGNRISYRYEISQQLTPSQISSLRERATSANRQVLCDRSETRALIEMGGEIEYVYFDRTGSRLFSTPVTSC